MFRKFTALAFLSVMTLLIALKHPVLGYCLCLDAYFTGGCVCQTAKLEKQQVSRTDTAKPGCPGCCSPPAAEQTPQSPADPQDPCDDCTKHLSIDVGDFVWSVSDGVPDTPECQLPAVVCRPTDFPRSGSAAYAPASARGAPPPFLAQSTPLHLRHCVLRL